MRLCHFSPLFLFLALGAQAQKETFEVRGGPSIFTPHDLVHLPRLSTSLPSPDGLHLLSSVSEQTGSTLYLSSLEPNSSSDPIPVVQGASSFLWLSASSFTYLDTKTNSLLVVKVVSPTIISPPKTLVTFPVPVGDLTYHSDSKTLAFTAEVWSDGALSTVVEQDEAYEKRGNEGQVFDSLFVRHWDTWRGPKSSQIFLLQLQKDGEVFKASHAIQNPLSEFDSMLRAQTRLFFVAVFLAQAYLASSSIIIYLQTLRTSHLPLPTLSPTSTSRRRTSSCLRKIPPSIPLGTLERVSTCSDDMEESRRLLLALEEQPLLPRSRLMGSRSFSCR